MLHVKMIRVDSVQLCISVEVDRTSQRGCPWWDDVKDNMKSLGLSSSSGACTNYE